MMLITLNIWSDIDFGYLMANSFGLWLLLGSFSALGIYFSSLTKQPIIAAILSFISLLKKLFRPLWRKVLIIS